MNCWEVRRFTEQGIPPEGEDVQLLKSRVKWLRLFQVGPVEQTIIMGLPVVEIIITQ